MRLSIPGMPGVYYDTDARSNVLTLALTAAGRRAPKPQGYAVQLFPYVWSFDVDLREVPTDHPIQYLHPEGAQSLGERSGDRTVRQAGTELESVLRFVWAVNQQVESAATQLIGRSPDRGQGPGVVIEITDGTVGVDGAALDTDEFDIEAGSTSAGSEAGVRARSPTEIDIEEEPTDSDDVDGIDETDDADEADDSEH